MYVQSCKIGTYGWMGWMENLGIPTATSTIERTRIWKCGLGRQIGNECEDAGRTKAAHAEDKQANPCPHDTIPVLD